MECARPRAAHTPLLHCLVGSVAVLPRWGQVRLPVVAPLLVGVHAIFGMVTHFDYVRVLASPGRHGDHADSQPGLTAQEVRRA